MLFMFFLMKLNRPINQELVEICQTVLAGLDDNVDCMPEDIRKFHGHAALDFARRVAYETNGIINFGNGEYGGGRCDNGTYFLEGNHHNLRLTEKMIRDIVNGRITKVRVNFEWDIPYKDY